MNIKVAAFTVSKKSINICCHFCVTIFTLNVRIGSYDQILTSTLWSLRSKNQMSMKFELINTKMLKNKDFFIALKLSDEFILLKCFEKCNKSMLKCVKHERIVPITCHSAM